MFTLDVFALITSQNCKQKHYHFVSLYNAPPSFATYYFACKIKDKYFCQDTKCFTKTTQQRHRCQQKNIKKIENKDKNM